MENIINTVNCILTSFVITNVTFDEFKPRPLLITYDIFYGIKIMLMTSSEVIETNHSLIKKKQCFQKV